MTWLAAGSLDPVPVLSALDLVARPVGAAHIGLDPDLAAQIGVARIDPDLADTAAFCERYGSALERSANCVVIRGTRGSDIRFAACVVLATTRADVNGLVRRRLDARSASFAPMDDAVERTRMEYGGITPLGLPRDWPVLVDPAVAASDGIVIGAGVRGAKLFLPGAVLARAPRVEVVEGLGLPPR
jgi:prolyl-tRNA editing enzyme YbaK/EbsC (Cys-tRNA(Pro) deacylase)